jgi:hypothetical protein
MKTAMLLAAITAACLPGAALAADVTAHDPAGVLKALGSLGYEAEMKTGTDGTSSISLKIDGSPSSIYFYNCNDQEANCETLLFSYGMDFEKGVALEKVNEWNYNTLHGFVYTDDEADPWLNLTMPTGAGISEELFADVMRMWRTRIGDVREFLDF